MTHPQFPYGGRPQQGPLQQYGEQYAQPPRQYAGGQQHRLAEPWQQGAVPPRQLAAGRPRSRQNSAFAAIVAVVLVILVGGGIAAWAFWPSRSVEAQAADKTAKSSLRGRSKEDLLKVLPSKQDMPANWVESGHDSVGVFTADSENCATVFPKNATTLIGGKYFGTPVKGRHGGVGVYLFEWTAEPRIDAVKDYIGRCATYVETRRDENGGPNRVYTVSVKEVEPPKVPAESVIGYEESGPDDYAAPEEEGRATLTDRYYIGSSRGVFLVLYCFNTAEVDAPCREVFTRTVTQLANID